MKNIFFLLILFKINISLKILSFPLKLQFTKYSYLLYSSYNATDYINENFKKELTFEMKIGTPSQKIDIYINPESSCFELKQSKPNSTNNYYPHKSSSFNINKIPNSENNYRRLITSNDIFNLSQNESYTISFVSLEKLNISNNMNISLSPELGINNPALYLGHNLDSCMSFIYDLKNMKAIDKRIISFKYDNKYKADFILGDDLTKYDPTHFNKEQYFTKYFSYEFSFGYDNIYVKYPWNKTEYVNITGNSKKKDAIINLNSGFIIGTEDFRNFIHENFFKNLIGRNICQMDLVNYNEASKKLGNEFYIYSCNHMQFTGQLSQRHESINYYSEFPNIIINSKSFEYDFVIQKKDLFEQVYNRQYFLVIFPKNIKDKNNKDIWYLGEPFYKRYPFTINLDAKTIGFYLDKKEINKKNNITKGIISDNHSSNNSKMKIIVIRIGEILIVLGLIFLAYYIGMKVKEGRKKRANELKDDCYEYISENKKDINEMENEQKKSQLVELNSKLGL